MKNKTFVNIGGKFDLDEDFDEFRASTSSRMFEESLQLQTMKSEDLEPVVPSQNNRTYSGQELFNSTREYQLGERSAAKSNQSEW